MEFTNLNILTFLIIFIIIISLLLLFYRLYFNQLKFNNEFYLLSSIKYFYIKYIFLIISLFIVLFSTIGVKYGTKYINNENKGIDMMFVLDVSKSMNVADISDSNYNYTRLDIIKGSIAKFVTSHKQDRFGLTIFAGDAISTIPLTTDHGLFLTFLKGVDYRNLIKQGSDFEKALSLGIDRFNDDNRSKALVFISDGGDSDDYINYNNIKQISGDKKNISYFVVGVGTNSGGRIIIGKDIFGRYSFQKYKGQYVISKINKSNLKDISSALNAPYFKVSNVNELDNLNKYINKLEKNVIKTGLNSELGDFGRKLTAISLFFYILFMLFYIFEDRIYFLISKNEK